MARAVVGGFFFGAIMEDLVWYGPWVIIGLAVLLKLARWWIKGAKKPAPKPDLKLYDPEPKPGPAKVYDPPLPPGFDPGYGYDCATREQKEQQAAMAWEVHNAEKEGRVADVQIHVGGGMSINGVYHKTAPCPGRDPIAEQKAIDRAAAEKAGTAADTVQPMSKARVEDLVEESKRRRQQNDRTIRDMIVREAEKMLGEERIREKKAELGEDGYRRFLDELVASVEAKSQQKTKGMADALLGRGGTLQDEADLMRGLGFKVPSEKGNDRPGA